MPIQQSYYIFSNPFILWHSLMTNSQFFLSSQTLNTSSLFCYINEPIYYRLAMFQIVELLLVLQFLQSSEGRSGEARSGVVGPALPAPVSMQESQGQIPTTCLFLLVLLQKEQVYLVYWLISIFITIFLRGPVL